MTSALAARLGIYGYAMTAARRAMPRADTRSTEARLWRYIYALGHYDLIAPAAGSNNLDPMLVAALIRQESLFDQRALSRAGAKGLMQLMLPTARAVAIERGEAPPSEADLYRPELSVIYGTHYLREKLAEFGDNVEVALAAYNAGEAKAREWAALPMRKPPALIKEHPHLKAFDPDLFMELIDYSETKDYVRRVRYNQETLHLFYDPPAGK
jgi:soluble lytic murein transglycosylase